MSDDWQASQSFMISVNTAMTLVCSCAVENLEHNDFIALRNMLLRYVTHLIHQHHIVFMCVFICQCCAKQLTWWHTYQHKQWWLNLDWSSAVCNVGELLLVSNVRADDVVLVTGRLWRPRYKVSVTEWVSEWVLKVIQEIDSVDVYNSVWRTSPHPAGTLSQSSLCYPARSVVLTSPTSMTF